MSLKSIEQVKQNKIFKPLDLIVYFLLAALIGALLMITFFQNEQAGAITGLEVKVKGKQVAVFSYADRTFRQTALFDGSCSMTEEKVGYLITIQTGEDGKNLLYIPKDGGKVTMRDANCSSDKDCTYMSIQNPMDAIICIPHSLVIVATTDELYIPDIIL